MLRKLTSLLGLIWLTSWVTLAQPTRSVIFNSQPQGAELRDQFGNFLGKTGQSIQLDWKGASMLELQVELKGYQRERMIVQPMQLQGRNDWPPRPLQLKALSSPWWPALGLLLLPGLALWKSRSKSQTVDSAALAVVPESGSLAGKVLGRYRLLERIGAGGMATVYRSLPLDARDSSEVVAVKVMRRELVHDTEMSQRFQRETRVTAALDHPNIVRVTDFGEQDGIAYLAMEWMVGGTLRDKTQGQVVALEDVWEAVAPLCSAVHYADTQGVVHRDLKPGNILITRAGVLKVTDFGLARSGPADKITATGAVLGTPAYMSPEQIQGEPPSPAMDQYAIGMIAYELLTGRYPFEDCEPVQLIFKTLMEEPIPPGTFRQLPGGVDEVILKMLEKQPEQRYRDLAEASLALRGALLG